MAGLRTYAIIGKHPEFVARITQAIIKLVHLYNRDTKASSRAKKVAYYLANNTEYFAKQIAPHIAGLGLDFDSTDEEILNALKDYWEKELVWILRLEKPKTITGMPD